MIGPRVRSFMLFPCLSGRARIVRAQRASGKHALVLTRLPPNVTAHQRSHSFSSADTVIPSCGYPADPLRGRSALSEMPSAPARRPSARARDRQLRQAPDSQRPAADRRLLGAVVRAVPDDGALLRRSGTSACLACAICKGEFGRGAVVVGAIRHPRHSDADRVSWWERSCPPDGRDGSGHAAALARLRDRLSHGLNDQRYFNPVPVLKTTT